MRLLILGSFFFLEMSAFAGASREYVAKFDSKLIHTHTVVRSQVITPDKVGRFDIVLKKVTKEDEGTYDCPTGYPICEDERGCDYSKCTFRVTGHHFRCEVGFRLPLGTAKISVETSGLKSSERPSDPLVLSSIRAARLDLNKESVPFNSSTSECSLKSVELSDLQLEYPWLPGPEYLSVTAGIPHMSFGFSLESPSKYIRIDDVARQLVVTPGIRLTPKDVEWDATANCKTDNTSGITACDLDKGTAEFR